MTSRIFRRHAAIIILLTTSTLLAKAVGSASPHNASSTLSIQTTSKSVFESQDKNSTTSSNILEADGAAQTTTILETSTVQTTTTPETSTVQTAIPPETSTVQTTKTPETSTVQTTTTPETSTTASRMTTTTTRPSEAASPENLNGYRAVICILLLLLCVTIGILFCQQLQRINESGRGDADLEAGECDMDDEAVVTADGETDQPAGVDVVDAGNDGTKASVSGTQLVPLVIDGGRSGASLEVIDEETDEAAGLELTPLTSRGDGVGEAVQEDEKELATVLSPAEERRKAKEHKKAMEKAKKEAEKAKKEAEKAAKKAEKEAKKAEKMRRAEEEKLARLAAKRASELAVARPATEETAAQGAAGEAAEAGALIEPDAAKTDAAKKPEASTSEAAKTDEAKKPEAAKTDEAKKPEAAKAGEAKKPEAAKADEAKKPEEGGSAVEVKGSSGPKDSDK